MRLLRLANFTRSARPTHLLSCHSPIIRIPIPAALHVLGVYARGAVLDYLPEAAFVAALEVDVFEVEGVDVAGEVAKEEGLAGF